MPLMDLPADVRKVVARSVQGVSRQGGEDRDHGRKDLWEVRGHMGRESSAALLALQFQADRFDRLDRHYRLDHLRGRYRRYRRAANIKLLFRAWHSKVWLGDAMGMMKNYILNLLQQCSEEQFGQDAIEWALGVGLV